METASKCNDSSDLSEQTNVSVIHDASLTLSEPEKRKYEEVEEDVEKDEKHKRKKKKSKDRDREKKHRERSRDRGKDKDEERKHRKDSHIDDRERSKERGKEKSERRSKNLDSTESSPKKNIISIESTTVNNDKLINGSVSIPDSLYRDGKEERSNREGRSRDEERDSHNRGDRDTTQESTRENGVRGSTGRHREDSSARYNERGRDGAGRDRDRSSRERDRLRGGADRRGDRRNYSPERGGTRRRHSPSPPPRRRRSPYRPIQRDDRRSRRVSTSRSRSVHTRRRSPSRGGESDRNRRSSRDEDGDKSNSGRSKRSGDDKEEDIRRDIHRKRSPSKENKNRSSGETTDKNDATTTDTSGNPTSFMDALYKPIMLKDIVAANPGISLPEAVMRMNAHNTAVARGMMPPGSDAAAMMLMQSSAASSSGLTANGAVGSVIGEGGALTKPHREIYIGNLPAGVTVPQLAEFLNTAFKQLGLSTSSNSNVNTVVTAWVSPDGHYAFAELRTIEDANAALTYLNGIQVGMYSLRIGRPKGYIGGSGVVTGATAMTAIPSSVVVPMQANLSASTGIMGYAGLGAANPLLAGFQSSAFVSTPSLSSSEPLSHVIMATNIPALVTEIQVKELFSSFGTLKAFNTIRTATGQTQSAVFEYEDSSMTDGIVDGLNKLDIGDLRIAAQRVPISSAAVLLKSSSTATTAAITPSPTSNIITTMDTNNNNTIKQNHSTSSVLDNSTIDELSSYPAGVVIRLSNLATMEDLNDDTLFEELLEDVADELNRHGTVKSIAIPRTAEDGCSMTNNYETTIQGKENSFVGNIYAEFVDKAGAEAALVAVGGRKFNGRVVQAVFYPVELFTKKVYSVPSGYLTSKTSCENEPAVENADNIVEDYQGEELD